jgi:cystathionine gamma-synthase
MITSQHHIQTLAVHAGKLANEKFGDIVQPIHLTTTFERNKDGSLKEYGYTRSANPNREVVEKKVAAIEGAKSAIAFSSGMAAISAIFETVLEPNCHVIIPDDCYHGTRTLLENYFKRWHITYTQVDMTSVSTVEQALMPNTRLIWIETPSNPQLKIADIKAITQLAEAHSIITACDNTFASPLLQKPLDLGADFSMHSSTKFFSGHSDILGGIVCTNNADKLTENLRGYQIAAGAVPSPFDCWLLNRSLATFPLRFALQCSNALTIAIYLSQHAKIEKVFYPGLPTHPNHTLAKQQMKTGFGSILSILIKGGQEEAFAFAAKLCIFKHATSLGGVESLVDHRRSVEGNHQVSPDNLVRIAVGIEYIDDLIADLAQALG